MSFFCGWVGGEAEPDRGRDLIGRMQAAIRCTRPDARHDVLVPGIGGGVAISGPALECHFSDLDGVSVVASGFPLWLDDALKKMSAERGVGAALAAGWRQRGRDLTRLVDGVSFAVIDANKRQALIAIDRLGVRPLCFARPADGALVFASTTDPLLAYPGISDDISPQAIFDLMFFTRIPAPETIYRDIGKLLPAQYLWFDGGSIEIGRYWHAPYEHPSSDGIDAQAARLRDIVQQSVTHGCAGLGPDEVGAFLSGGIDSSTVLGCLSQALGREARAFSIGFDAEGYDEMEFARATAQHFGNKLVEYYVTPKDIVDLIDILPVAYDEPFANTSVVPAYYCAKLARDHGISLMLAGDGGDELFGGNSRYVRQSVFGFYSRVPGWLRRGLVEPALALPLPDSISVLRKARSYVEQANVPMPDRLEAANYYRGRDLREVFSESIAGQIEPDHPLALMREAFERTTSDHLLPRMLHLDQQMTLADDDLRKVSRMCERAGVSVAYPLLDMRVVEHSASLPPSMMMARYKLRSYFKYAFRDFLPQSTLTKEKHGFGLPFGTWLRTYAPLQDRARSALDDLKKRDLFATTFIDDVLNAHRDGHDSYHGELIWVLMMLELWLQDRGRGSLSGLSPAHP